MGGRIDGLILMAPDEGSIDPIHSIARRYPVLLLNPRFQVNGCSSVRVANVEGSRALVGHLLGLGHRRIAMVKGPAKNLDADERLRGYRDALVEANVGLEKDLEIDGAFTEYSGYEAAERLMKLENRPTAVFAANDSMAIGLLSAFRERDVSVPGDIAVVGFDDISMASYVSPALTTAHVDAYQLGTRAVRLLLPALEPPMGRKVQREVIPAPLVVRQSCGS
jgi:LacI family transcriptional regulator